MKWRRSMVVAVVLIVGAVGGTAFAQDDTDDTTEQSELTLDGIIKFINLIHILDEAGELDGGISVYQDDSEDTINLIFDDAVDTLDTSLPAWDALSGAMFTVRSDVPPNYSLGDNLVSIEPGPGDEYTPYAGDYTFYGRFTMTEAVDNREPLGTHWCNVAVHARDPDRRTTNPISVISDKDPASDTNLSWKLWFGPNGEMFTSKTDVNPEQGVALAVTEHATLGLIEGNAVTLAIPAEEFAGVDRIVLSAGCTPLDFTDYNDHVFDAIADVEVSAGFLDPAWVFEGADEPIVDTSIRTAVADSIAPIGTGDEIQDVDDDLGELETDDVVIDGDEECTDPNCGDESALDEAAEEGADDTAPAVLVVIIVVGASATAGGYVLFRRAGEQR